MKKRLLEELDAQKTLTTEPPLWNPKELKTKPKFPKFPQRDRFSKTTLEGYKAQIISREIMRT
jgi:hypothetical protein